MVAYEGLKNSLTIPKEKTKEINCLMSVYVRHV